MTSATITFIGAGNMASAIIAGLRKHDYPASAIWATNPSCEKLQRLQQQYGIQTTSDNAHAVANADVVILAVKPQKLEAVARSFAERENQPLFISLAVGVTEPSLQHWLGDETPIIRCMPNTPSLVGYGTSGLFANTYVSAEQREIANQILSAVGITAWVGQEADIDKIAAISGSGPAYFFLTLEALQQAGEKLGLPSAMVRQLAVQTALGSALMAQQSTLELSQLRCNVTSPGGTTEQAINTLTAGGLVPLYQQALEAAMQQAGVLAKQLG